jgi:hypothetical protein
VLLAIISIGSLFSPAGYAEVSTSELQHMYINYLIGEGYKPKVDREGDIRFMYEGEPYYIDVNTDPYFFRIVLIKKWPIESEPERRKVLVTAADSNATVKVAKVFTIENLVWFSSEVFVSKPEQFKGIFKRSMSALQTVKNVFIKKMRE